VTSFYPVRDDVHDAPVTVPAGRVGLLGYGSASHGSGSGTGGSPCVQVYPVLPVRKIDNILTHTVTCHLTVMT